MKEHKDQDNNENLEHELETQEELQEFDKFEKEEIESLIEYLESAADEKNIRRTKAKILFFNYALHQNFLVHILLQLAINIAVFSAVLGLSSLGIFTPDYPIGLYFAGLALFTFSEIIIKLFFFRFLYKPIIKSFGAIHLIYIVPLLYVSIHLVAQIQFVKWIHMIIVGSFFLSLRLITSYYIKILFFHRRDFK